MKKKFEIYTLDALEVLGKTVILRVDINQPIDKATDTLADDTRIKGCIPTIRELKERGAKVVVLAHQGSDIEYENFYTLRPHAKVISKLLGEPVKFIPDVCGPAAQQAIGALAAGEVLLLDNVRFMSEEQTLFENSLKLTHEQQAQTMVVKTLAPLADYYVCDAFAAAHRSQPTLCGFQQVLPSAMGRLFEKEYSIISSLMEAPERPSVFVLGGAKIADAFLMLRTVLERGAADKILTGGLAGHVLLAAKGISIGRASLNFIEKKGFKGFIQDAKQLLAQYGNKIQLPLDLAYVSEAERKESDIHHLDDGQMYMDIGAKTVARYEAIILEASTIFVNGPMGVFEKEVTEYGTKGVWNALAHSKGYTVIGGGDSVTATNRYGLQNQMGYICTGGGALIRFLTGEELPVIKALRYAADKYPLEG